MLELRKVVKENKDTVQNDCREKYRELKIESNRGKPAETFYMGKQSISSRDIMSREQGEILREEISMRREKEEVIREEGRILGDIIGESQ